MIRPLTLHTRRWRITVDTRALILQEQPNPNCPTCRGDGAWWERWGSNAEMVQCSCWGRYHYINLRPRDRAWDEPPF